MKRRRPITRKLETALLVFGVGVGMGIVRELFRPRRDPLPPTVPLPKRFVEAEFKVKP